MNGRFACASDSTPDRTSPPSYSFPKSSRLLRRSDFDRVYKTGARYGGPYFALFYTRPVAEDLRCRVGFTVPKRLGEAVFRNKLRRRLREAVRHEMPRLRRACDLVIQPRPPAAEASLPALRAELVRAFEKCGLVG